MAKRAGFTLMEVVIVLTLVASLATLVGLAADGLRSSAPRAEAERLAATVRLAGREAILEGTELMLALSPAGYGFFSRDGHGRWGVLQDDELLAPHALPAGTRIALVAVEGADEAQAIVLSASGETRAFVVTLEGGGEAYRVEGGTDGAVRVAADER
jgi:type II secretion system protein H